MFKVQFIVHAYLTVIWRVHLVPSPHAGQSLSSQPQASNTPLSPLKEFSKKLKEMYSEMNVLPDDDWPPSIDRHESNLALVQHGRHLPGEKETEKIQKSYVGGKVDCILEEKKEIQYETMFDFMKPKSKKKFKMLIDGAPGVGKTTLCRKFCKDWGAGETLQQFSNVWLLHLREEEIAKAKSIDDLFQHHDEDLLREVIRQMKKTGGEDNLLVWDGFDELSKKERTKCSLFLEIFRGKVLPNCSVIVTSRPYASQQLQQNSILDVHVEVAGFTREQIKECIRRNITDEAKAEELIEQLKHRLDILSLCYIPLNSAIILYVYKQDDHKLPTTLTELYTLYTLHTLKRSVEIHSVDVDPDDITDLANLSDPISLPFKALCEMAFNGLQNDQLGFSNDQLPQSLKCLDVKGTKPELLGLMSGTKRFSRSGRDVSYHFTHLTVQEFLAALHAATELSAEEQSKLFLENLENERFRMMLLFLSGITGLKDAQLYEQIMQMAQEQVSDSQSIDLEDPKESQLFFLSHLIYESQNASLSPILAKGVQENRMLSVKFNDPFHCTVLTYFLSTSNIPIIELVDLTDEQIEIIQQVSCESASSSEVRGEKQTSNVIPQLPFLKCDQELNLKYVFFPSRCNYLSRLLTLNAKQLVSLDISAMPEGFLIFNTLKANTFIQSVKLHIGLTDDSVSHIAEWLAKNPSLKTLDISRNRITSVGAERIFRALESNTTLETLEMSSIPGSLSPISSTLPPSTLHAGGVLSHTVSSSLTNVKVGLSYFTPECFTSLLKALSRTTKLVTLVLRGLDYLYMYHEVEATLIKDVLNNNNTSLQLLELTDLGLSDATAMHIAAWLGENRSLKKLAVARSVTSMGADRIFRALALENKETLKLCEASIRSPSLSPVLSLPIPSNDVLSCNSSLTELTFSDFNLAPQWWVSLFKTLNHFSSLKMLDVSGNSFDQAASEALADMLSSTQSLKQLIINRCDYQPKALARGLLHNTTLNHIHCGTHNGAHLLGVITAELRRQDGHTEHPDVISRFKRVLGLENLFALGKLFGVFC